MYNVLALTEQDFLVYEDYLKFDFDDISSNVTAVGYINVVGATTYALGLGYGWNAPVVDTDRGAPTPLTRDFHQTTVDYTFYVDVDSETLYNLTFTTGDQSYTKGPFNINVEGTEILSNITTSVAEFKILASPVPINCTDGVLTILMDADEVHSWALNGLVIEKGVVDTDAWLQYQIDQAEILAEENFNDNIGIVVLFFAAGISILLGLIYAKRKR